MERFEELGKALRRLHDANSKMIGLDIEKDLNPKLIFLLFSLYHKQEMKSNDISSFFGVTPGAATKIIDNLEKKQLVERAPSKTDRRIIMVKLSDYGQKFVKKKKEQKKNQYEEALKNFSDPELEKILDSFHEIAKRFEEYLGER